MVVEDSVEAGLAGLAIDLDGVVSSSSSSDSSSSSSSSEDSSSSDSSPHPISSSADAARY